MPLGSMKKMGFPPKRKKQKIIVSANTTHQPSAAVPVGSSASGEPRDAISKTTSKYLATGVKKQLEAEEIYKQALQEDSSVFDYDGVYDDVSTRTRDEQRKKIKAKEERTSKYIDKLKRTAKQREFVTEKAMNRKAAREALEDEATFGKASEVFVTAAYKRRLEERKRWEEEEERRAKEEAENDVRKQSGLSQFYSGMLEKLDDPSRTQIQTITAPQTSQRESNGTKSDQQVLEGELNTSLPEETGAKPESKHLETEVARRRRGHENMMAQVSEARRKRAEVQEMSRKVAPAPSSTSERIAAARARALERRKKLVEDRQRVLAENDKQ